MPSLCKNEVQGTRAQPNYGIVKGRYSVQERSAITHERMAGNACCMARYQRCSPSLTVPSVAKAGTRWPSSRQGPDTCLFVMDVSTSAGTWLNRDTPSPNGERGSQNMPNHQRSQ